MKYFQNFPKLIYTFDKDVENQQLVVNLLARSSFLREIANNTDIAYDYSIQDSDNPEIIAHKFYGDPYRNWIILLFNRIINPYYDWPLKNDAFEKYVVDKYGTTLEVAKSTIHHYEKVVESVSTTNGVTLDSNTKTFVISTYDYNETTGTLTENTLPNTADTSLVVSTESFNYNTYVLTVTTTHKAVSNYTYELNENDKKRIIRLLDATYASQVENEFIELMKNG